MLLHTVILYYLVSEPEPDQMLNLTSVEVLNAYLDSFISPNVNIGSSDGLSAGAIAGIVISVIVIIIVLAVISAVSIHFCKYSKYKVK